MNEEDFFWETFFAILSNKLPIETHNAKLQINL